MPPRRTHYEVLGVARTAAPEEIKQQYRRLAKRYHPDVAAAADAAAAQRAFVRINEAYEILMDPQKRRAYDHDLRVQETKEERPSPKPGEGQRRSGGPPPPGARTAGAHPPPPQGHRPPVRPDIAQLLLNARMDFARNRTREAIAACREAIARDARCGGAYSLLGDIYRLQRRLDDAVRMYTMAVQINPDSREDLAKLELAARHGAASGSGKRPQLGPAVHAATVLGTLLAAALFVLPVVYRGTPVFAGFQPISEWTDNLLIAMVGVGVIIGFLITVTGAIGRLDEEFLTHGLRTAGGHVPVGVLVLLLSFIFFPLALLAFLVVSLVEERASGGMVRVLVFATVAVVLFALTVPAAAWQTILLGGNVVFPCMILGSFTGGFFREPW